MAACHQTWKTRKGDGCVTIKNVNQRFLVVDGPNFNPYFTSGNFQAQQMLLVLFIMSWEGDNLADVAFRHQSSGRYLSPSPATNATTNPPPQVVTSPERIRWTAVPQADGNVKFYTIVNGRNFWLSEGIVSDSSAPMITSVETDAATLIIAEQPSQPAWLVRQQDAAMLAIMEGVHQGFAALRAEVNLISSGAYTSVNPETSEIIPDHKKDDNRPRVYKIPVTMVPVTSKQVLVGFHLSRGRSETSGNFHYSIKSADGQVNLYLLSAAWNQPAVVTDNSFMWLPTRSARELHYAVHCDRGNIGIRHEITMRVHGYR